MCFDSRPRSTSACSAAEIPPIQHRFCQPPTGYSGSPVSLVFFGALCRERDTVGPMAKAFFLFGFHFPGAVRNLDCIKVLFPRKSSTTSSLSFRLLDIPRE